MTSRERVLALARAPIVAWRLAARGRYDFTYDGMRFRLGRMSAARRANLVRAGLNLLHRRAKPWSMPLHAQFELANVCPLQCPVCPTGLRELTRPPAFMDPALFERAFDEAGPYLLTASLWGWGEPLLHPQLRRILAAARRHPVATLLSTNGQPLADAAVIDAILAHPPTHLIVALDGLTDEANRRYRRGAALAPAIEGVSRLAAAKRASGQALPVLHLRYTVMEHNARDVARVADFAREAGFDGLTMRSLVIAASDAAIRHHAELAPATPAPTSGPRMTTPAAGFHCLQPFWFPSVFADGTVVACEQDFNAEAPLGRVTAGTGFRDIWYSPEAAQRRREAASPGHQAMACCARCPLASSRTTDLSTPYIDLTGGGTSRILIPPGAVRQAPPLPVTAANGQRPVHFDHAKNAQMPRPSVPRPKAMTSVPDVAKRKIQPKSATRFGSG
jgi:MoaA/NifB/PqqE/SkfB family radical SAM enzyme